ncbi:uncharacterized protein [Nicotiana sylvestris]|uniref:S-antigen protein-like n=1 Tax=Nicotiana sylvestris TaxID=4096 RepID=A0A1U7WV75_NICSY|nr:PREDICTED: S-antigen protein-like [Nicotiana sylvestris]
MIYLMDATDAQVELKRVLDSEERIKEYALCRSRRRVLEEIGASGFVLPEDLARARADERGARSLLSDAEESEIEANSIADISEMRPAPTGEETESPILKSGKNNKTKRVSKPEDPQDGKGPTQRHRRNLIHVDIDSVHQLHDEEEDEGKESALVTRARKPTNAAKPSEPETLPRGEEALKKDTGKAYESLEVFTKCRADQSQCEAELKKASNEGKALKLLCSQKEEGLKDQRADLAKARKNEAELDKQANTSLSQLQQKLEMVGLLRGEVNYVKVDCNRWKENMERLVAEKEAILAKLTSAETQLQGAKEKNSAQAKRIDELEAKLAEAGAEVAEARAEVEKTKATADKIVAVY